MEGLLLGVILGAGTLLVFDGITRPEGRLPIAKWAARLGPGGAGGITGAAVGLFLTGWPIAAAAGAAIGAIAPGALARMRSEKDRLKRMDAIAEVSARIRDALRSGIGIHDALGQAAKHAPPVLASHLHRLVSDTRVSGLSDAATGFAQRVNDPAGDLFASALGLADRLGARHTSELLDSLAESAAARTATLREARARQTRNRVSAQIVAAAPVLLLLAIRQANPEFLEPFKSLNGQFVLAVAFGMIAAGYFLMLKVARVERAVR